MKTVLHVGLSEIFSKYISNFQFSIFESPKMLGPDCQISLLCDHLSCYRVNEFESDCEDDMNCACNRVISSERQQNNQTDHVTEAIWDRWSALLDWESDHIPDTRHQTRPSGLFVSETEESQFADSNLSSEYYTLQRISTSWINAVSLVVSDSRFVTRRLDEDSYVIKQMHSQTHTWALSSFARRPSRLPENHYRWNQFAIHVSDVELCTLYFVTAQILSSPSSCSIDVSTFAVGRSANSLWASRPRSRHLTSSSSVELALALAVVPQIPCFGRAADDPVLAASELPAYGSNNDVSTHSQICKYGCRV